MRAFLTLTTDGRDHVNVHTQLGHGWLQRKVTDAVETMRRRNDLSPNMLGLTSGKTAHPLVSELYSAASSSSGAPSETPLLDLLEADLFDLGQTLPVDLRQRLRLDAEAMKVMYELHIAAGFKRLGHTLSWLPDRGQKRPEMIVSVRPSFSISVECKRRDSRDGYRAEADRFWKHFQYRLRKRMDEVQLNYWVKISAAEFRLGEVDRVVKASIEAMSLSANGSVDLMSGKYRLDFARLADPGGSVPCEIFALFPRGVFGLNVGESQRYQLTIPRNPGDNFAQGPVTNPKLLRLELMDNSSRRIEGVLRNLRNSSKQVRLGLPSLVYVETSLDNYEKECAEFEGMVSAVKSELDKAHTRVSAVVLTSIYPSFSMDGYLAWRVRAEFISQPRPKHPLPPDLQFPGDPRGSRWIPGNWSEGL